MAFQSQSNTLWVGFVIEGEPQVKPGKAVIDVIRRFLLSKQSRYKVVSGIIMSFPSHLISQETPSDAKQVAALQTRALGPGRFTLTAERMRSGHPVCADLSWLIRDDQSGLLASLRFNKIFIGDCPALMLGPLVVNPLFKGQGFGKALVRHSLHHIATHKPHWVFLVGDLPYYRLFGFSLSDEGHLLMPGPADPGRLLLCEAGETGYARPSGHIRMRL